MEKNSWPREEAKLRISARKKKKKNVVGGLFYSLCNEKSLTTHLEKAIPVKENTPTAYNVYKIL